MKSIISLGLLFLLLASAGASDFVDRAAFEIAPGVKIVLRASRFVPSKHTIRRVGGELLIDGHQVFGVDGEAPLTQLSEAYLLVNGRKIALDTSCLYDPWFTSITRKSFGVSGGDAHHKPDAGHLNAVDASFSNGAGAYRVEWNIVGGTSLRVKITSGY